MIKKCPLCGRRVLKKYFIYCPRCSHFVHRLEETRSTAQARDGVLDYVHEHGFVCKFTGISLNFDPKSPWYCVFDHWIPGDNRRLDLTCFLVNEMKTALSGNEFEYYVAGLHLFKKYGIKIRKKKLKCWKGWYRQPYEDVPILEDASLGPLGRKKCCICGKRFCVGSYNEKYCRMCAEIVWRMESKKFPPATVKAVLDYIRKYGYVCYYTGMKLDTRDPRSPWYAVLDHWMPENPKKIVLTSALFNCMKTDLTEDEFWYYIEQIYNYLKKGLKAKKKRLVYWYRIGQRVLS